VLFVNFSFSGFGGDGNLRFPPSQSEDVVVYGGREGFGQDGNHVQVKLCGDGTLYRYFCCTVLK
jgi:hypothetical protein